MSFSGFIWDLKSEELSNMLETKKPVVLFCKNILISKIISDTYKSLHVQAKTAWGYGLSKSWLESSLEGLPLLGEKEPYVFLHLKKQLGQEILNLLIQEIQIGETHFYHFESEKSIGKKIKGLDFVELNIKEMKQWHVPKLIDYICKTFNLEINSAERQELDQWPIEDSLGLYQNLLNYSLGVTDIAKIKKNNFYISDLFCNKNIKMLYQELINQVESDSSGKIFQILSLIRGMIIKCADKDYLQSSKTRTKYIQNLQSAQGKYSPLELSSMMKDLSSLEISFKKSPEDGLRLLKNLSLR